MTGAVNPEKTAGRPLASTPTEGPRTTRARAGTEPSDGEAVDGAFGRLSTAAHLPVAVSAVNLSLLVLLSSHLWVLATMTATSTIAVRHLDWPSGRSPASRPIGVYYMLAVLGAVASLNLGSALHWAEAVAIVSTLFVPAAIASAADRIRICRLVVGFAGALAAYSVLELIAGLSPIGGPLRRDDGTLLPMPNEIFLGSGLGRAQAMLGHPLLLSFVLVTAVGLALRRDVLPRAHWRILVVLALSCGILASGSRSAAAVAVMLVLFTSAARPRTRLLTGVGGLVGLVLVGAAGGVMNSAVVRNFLSDPSLSHRVAGLDAARHLVSVQSWWQTLVGNGYWSVPYLFEQGRLQSDGFHAVDNQFVYTFAELGVVGVLVLGWLVTRSLLRTDGLLIGAVGAAVAMFLSYDVLVTPSSLGLLALLLGLSRRSRTSPARMASISLRGRTSGGRLVNRSSPGAVASS